MLGTYHTGALLEALSDLHAIHTEEKLYPFVLNRASEVLKAQGGTYFSVLEEKGELYPEASKGVALTLLREVPFKMKLGVSGWCASNRQPARVDNVQTDERFNRAVDVITGIRTRSILCVPVLLNHVLYGVLELVNRVDGVFREPDQEFLQFFARHVAVALENCRSRGALGDRLGYNSALISSATSGIIATDLKGVVSVCNGSAGRILGLSPSDVVGRPVGQALAAFPAFVSSVEATQKRQAPAGRQETKIERGDGEKLVVGYSTFIIRAESEHLGIALVFQDITAFAHPS
jgi:PAS domain S-box-containing protein